MVHVIVPLVLLTKVPIVVGEEKLPLASQSWAVNKLPGSNNPVIMNETLTLPAAHKVVEIVPVEIVNGTITGTLHTNVFVSIVLPFPNSPLELRPVMQIKSRVTLIIPV